MGRGWGGRAPGRHRRHPVQRGGGMGAETVMSWAAMEGWRATEARRRRAAIVVGRRRSARQLPSPRATVRGPTPARGGGRHPSRAACPTALHRARYGPATASSSPVGLAVTVLICDSMVENLSNGC